MAKPINEALLSFVEGYIIGYWLQHYVLPTAREVQRKLQLSSPSMTARYMKKTGLVYTESGRFFVKDKKRFTQAISANLELQ